MKPGEILAAELDRHYDDALERRRLSIFERRNVWASRRATCVRRMCLDLKHPEDDVAELNRGSIAKMDRGKDRERDIAILLTRLGAAAKIPFEIIEGQKRIEVKHRGTVVISGKQEGKVKFLDPRRRKSTAMFEIKSGDAHRRCKSIEDLDQGRWTRHTIDQLLACMKAEKVRRGLIIIDTGGIPRLIDVDGADPTLAGRAESFIRDAWIAKRVKEKKRRIPAHTKRVELCGSCHHLNRTCFPPKLKGGPGALVVIDQYLIDAVEARQANAKAHREYENATAIIKERLRGIEVAIVGSWLVTGSWSPRKITEIPPKIRKRYTRTEEKGTFRFTFDPIAPVKGGGGVRKKRAGKN